MMSFTLPLTFVALLVSRAATFPLLARDASDADIARLAPDLGITPGIPFGDGSADCRGFNNSRIGCQCPPPREVYIQALQTNVHAGHCVNNTVVTLDFPTDDSLDSQSARLHAAAVTLQNLESAGHGCPTAATTFKAQQAAIDGKGSPAPSSDAPSATATSDAPPTATDSPAPGSPDGELSDALIEQLAPTLGFRKCINPTGTGDCDGATNGTNGKPIKISCDCPPERDVFIAKLIANVRAGKVVQNPSVKISFPTGDSDDAKLARINAASSTLQNLNGVGDGCPTGASTTLTAQDAAIRAGQPPPPDLSNAPAPGNDDNAPSDSDDGSNAPADAPASGGGSVPDSGDFPSDPTQLSDAQIDQLTPDLGFTAGQNPTGTGDCDGATKDKNGNIIKVQCSCPPARADFIGHVIDNVRANQVVNNTVVPWAFPTGNSLEDQIARIRAATVTLQNLVSAGKGCPNAATTLGKQQTDLEAQQKAQQQ